MASEMDNTNVSPNAIVGLETLSDALSWSDEYPEQFASPTKSLLWFWLLL